jgi:2-keto-3-deoxy-L-rhamnonate aldolase RhmA
MQPARDLMEKVRRNEVVVGVLATDHVWTDLVEICVRAGLDYLIVDMEHGPHNTELVGEVCATGRRLDFPVLIRPRSNDYATLRLAVDLGCCGFLLASIESAKELDVVVDALHMPPRGRRRPGGLGNRWVENYGYDSWRTEIEDRFIVLPQVETKVGMRAAAEIAGHAVTSALAVGPFDLSAELGCCGEMQAPVLREALGSLQRTAAAASKPMWMIGPRGEDLVQGGWRFICVGEPTWILASAMRHKADEARAAAAK